MYKKIIPILIIMICFILIIGIEAKADYHLILGDRILRLDYEGADVAILQRKLKELSLYHGKVDGIYGPGTSSAVRRFQSKFNLKVDGIAGQETISRLPVDNLVSRMDVSREEIIILARIINGEARGESFRGKVGVGAVIINRVESSKFPNSIREVILQKGQFSSLMDGQAIYYPSTEALEAAKAALLGYDPTRESLFFYNPKVATNLKWISSRPIVRKIGDHLFAR